MSSRATGYGVDLTGAGTNDNVVAGNYAGTNATGTAALGNCLSGVGSLAGASSNTIGGTAAGAGNVLSGNHNNSDSRGIYITNAGTDFNVVDRQLHRHECRGHRRGGQRQLGHPGLLRRG